MENNSFETADLSLVEQDCRYIWHPFTQSLTARKAIPIVRGKGASLYAEDGSVYLDGISSWWVNLHGHAHPHIVDKIKRQAETLEHVIFADFTHPPAIELARRLIHLIPGEFSKVFFSDNGSTAVEAALKMAFQYWHNQDPTTKRAQVICFKGSYHGDTFGAMSAAGKNNFNKPFWRHLFDVQQIDLPMPGKEEVSLAQLKALLAEGKTACFIFEPLILGVGGMTIYSKIGLDLLLKECRQHGTLTIADEVMTGFGRTGTLFACEQLKEKPAIMCLSKGLTGGFLPLGATVCKQEVFNAFLSQDLSQAFLHGHSYSGNPLACASALASLDLLEKEECRSQISQISLSHQRFCEKWNGHPRLKRCESLGSILALTYQSSQNSSYFHPLRDQSRHFFLDKGILLRPFGIRFMYCRLIALALANFNIFMTILF